MSSLTNPGISNASNNFEDLKNSVIKDLESKIPRMQYTRIDHDKHKENVLNKLFNTTTTTTEDRLLPKNTQSYDHHVLQSRTSKGLLGKSHIGLGIGALGALGAVGAYQVYKNNNKQQTKEAMLKIADHAYDIWKEGV